jgi:hypothetical protein
MMSYSPDRAVFSSFWTVLSHDRGVRVPLLFDVMRERLWPTQYYMVHISTVYSNTETRNFDTIYIRKLNVLSRYKSMLCALQSGLTGTFSTLRDHPTSKPDAVPDKLRYPRLTNLLTYPTYQPHKPERDPGSRLFSPPIHGVGIPHLHTVRQSRDHGALSSENGHAHHIEVLIRVLYLLLRGSTMPHRAPFGWFCAGHARERENEAAGSTAMSTWKKDEEAVFRASMGNHADSV